MYNYFIEQKKKLNIYNYISRIKMSKNFSHFFFYNNLKDSSLIHKISPFFFTINGEIDVEYYDQQTNELILGRNNRNSKLEGVVTTFNIPFSEVINRLNFMKLGSLKKKMYRVELVEVNTPYGLVDSYIIY